MEKIHGDEKLLQAHNCCKWIQILFGTVQGLQEEPGNIRCEIGWLCGVICTTVAGYGGDPRPTGPEPVHPANNWHYLSTAPFVYFCVSCANWTTRERERQTESKECFVLHTYRGFPKLHTHRGFRKLLTTLTFCIPYFSIDNAHPKLFRHSFWCIDNAHDAN